MPRDNEYNPDPNENAARILSTASTDELPADVEGAWREWSGNVQNVDQRTLTLLRAAFEAGCRADLG